MAYTMTAVVVQPSVPSTKSRCEGCCPCPPQQGQYSHEEGLLFLNVVFGDLESLVHEVLHSKIDPNDVAQLDSPIDKLSKHLCEMIRGRNPDTWSEWQASLEKARPESLNKMLSFDAELGSVLPIGDWEGAH